MEPLSVELRKFALVKTLEVENAALPTIAWMEYMGMGFDLDSWQLLSGAAESEVASSKIALDQVLKNCLGETAVNWNSPKQVMEALARLGLTVSDTKQNSLEEVKEAHHVVPLLLAYREVSKRASTYGKDWLEHVNMETGRIHPDWRQIGSEPGRTQAS